MFFTETQWRVLESYIEPQNKSMEELLRSLALYSKFRHERVNGKKLKIQELIAWLQSESCRRQYILEYFGEKFETRNHKKCCDRCGLELSIFFHNRNNKQNKVLVDWKEQLASILNI